MRCSLRSKGVFLLSVILVHTALGNPVVKRDVQLLLDGDSKYSVGAPVVSLENADVFGGEVHENGARDKRTILKLKGLALTAAAKAVGTGVKAVGAGVATVAAAGAKTVGKAALGIATTVGLKVAKAAITIGIAKLLLSLVFGKISHLIAFKTKLLGGASAGKGLLGSSNLSSLSNSGSSSGTHSVADEAAHSYDGNDSATDGAASDSGVGEDLPEIDPQKVSLQIPSEIVSGSFNVVNRAAPVVGEVIQRTAERLVNVGASLKPLFASSLGFGQNNNLKRETDQPSEGKYPAALEQTNEASSEFKITEEPPSQFKRSYDPVEISEISEIISAAEREVVDKIENESETSDESKTEEETIEEDEKKLVSALLARKVIDKLLQQRLQQEEIEKNKNEPNNVKEQIVEVTERINVEPPSTNVQTITLQTRADSIVQPNNPYYNQQYRNYNPHVKRQATFNNHYQYQQPYYNNYNNPYYNQPYYPNQYIQTRYR